MQSHFLLVAVTASFESVQVPFLSQNMNLSSLFRIKRICAKNILSFHVEHLTLKNI